MAVQNVRVYSFFIEKRKYEFENKFSLQFYYLRNGKASNSTDWEQRTVLTFEGQKIGIQEVDKDREKVDGKVYAIKCFE